MLWTRITIFVLSIPALPIHAQADSFSFDVSPLSIKECSGRPPNDCGPRTIHRSDCAFLEPSKESMHKLVQQFDDNVDNSSFTMNHASKAQTHVTLQCNYAYPEDVKTEDVAAQVRAIRRRSPRRAIYLTLQYDTLLDPRLFVSISHQIVRFDLLSCTNSTVTSRLPLFNFTNLLELTLGFGEVSIRIQKADFSHLQNLRLIHFYEIRFDTIEPGTFTDLPELKTLWIRYYFPSFDNNAKALHLLNCDAQFNWLWDWLDKHPHLLQDRQMGEVYQIGNLENDPTVDMLTKNCTTSGITMKPRVTVRVFVQVFD